MKGRVYRRIHFKDSKFAWQYKSQEFVESLRLEETARKGDFKVRKRHGLGKTKYLNNARIFTKDLLVYAF